MGVAPASGERLDGTRGADRLVGGSKGDRIDGGRGNDRIRAVDGRRDVVVCGSGRDLAELDARDASTGCERRRRWACSSARAASSTLRPQRRRRRTTGAFSRSSQPRHALFTTTRAREANLSFVITNLLGSALRRRKRAGRCAVCGAEVFADERRLTLHGVLLHRRCARYRSPAATAGSDGARPSSRLA